MSTLAFRASARLRFAPAFVAVVVLAAGCAATRSAVPGRLPNRAAGDSPTPLVPVLTDEDRAAGHFLAATVARFDNDYATATKETAKAVTLDPDETRLRAQLAELYVRGGDLRKALEHARVLSSLAGQDVEPRLFQGRLEVALQDFDAAIRSYQAVLAIDSNDQEALALLGALYSRLADHERAAQVYSRLTALSPEFFIGNFGLGKALAAQGRYEEALRSLRHAARLSGGNAEVHLYMGFVYDRLGLARRAVDSFNKAIEFGPELEVVQRSSGPLDEDDPELAAKLRRFERWIDFAEDPLAICTKIGLADYNRGDFMRAVTDFNIVLGARPGDDETRYWLALAYGKVGDLDATVRELAAVSPRSARYVDARRALASILQERGDLEGAVAAMNELLSVMPDNPDALRDLIQLYRELKRFDKAIEHTRRLLETDRRNDAYLYGLAWLYDDAGDKEQAIAILRQVIEINPQNADALNHLGYTYAERGTNLDEAEDLIRRALELHPNSAAIVDSLAWVHFQRGDYDAAVEDLERATALGGRDPVIVEHLGDAYLRVGREVDAERTYRDAEARTENPDQRRSLQRKIHEIRRRWRGDVDGEAGETS